jgi:NitT/TauT family transport system substrate-binding protein
MVLRIAVLATFITVPLLQCSIGHAAETKTVRLAHWGQSKVFIYLPLYVANDLGYFREEGIDLQIVYSGNDDQVFAAVVGGSAIAGLADPVFAAVSRERGGPGRTIAMLVNRVANWGIGKNASMANFQFPQDLNNRSISSFPAPSTAYSILKDIQTKFSLDQMKIVELAPGTEVAALQRGDVDIALTGEPAVSVAEENGFPVVLSLGSYYGPFAFSGITTTDESIKKSPRELQALVSGLQRALEFMRSNPSETADIAARNFSSIERPVIQRAVKRLIDEDCIPDSVKVSADAWDRAIKLRKEIGDLKTDQHGGAVDNQFADVAVDKAKREQARVERSAEVANLPKQATGAQGMQTGGTHEGGQLVGFAWWKHWIEFWGAITGIVGIGPILWGAYEIIKRQRFIRRTELFRREPYRKIARELLNLIGAPQSTMGFERAADHLANRDICDNNIAISAINDLVKSGFIEKFAAPNGTEIRLNRADGQPLLASIAY